MIDDRTRELMEAQRAIVAVERRNGDVPLVLPVLPEELWAARTAFAAIRQTAWSLLIHPDALFGAVLAYVAYHADHRFVLPRVVSRYASLNLFAGIVGPSGAGKGSALDGAADLFDITGLASDFHQAEEALGSGEGIAKSYWGQVRADDGKGTDWQRTRQSILVRADEGAMLADLANRRGSTLMTVLNQAWSGERIGFNNADRTRRFPVEPFSYRLAAVIGLQPLLAQAIFAAEALGFPQRFLWLWGGTDPEAPYPPPATPKAETITLPRWNAETTTTIRSYQCAVLELDPAVAQEIRRRRWEHRSGHVEADPLDSHGDLGRLKVAGLLALMQGEAAVSTDDWRLAGLVHATSLAVRDHMRRVLHSEQNRKAEAAIEHEARKAARSDEAVEQSRIERLAARVRGHVSTNGTDRCGDGYCTRACITIALGGRDRDLRDEAVSYAVTRQWIDERDGRFYRRSP